MERFPHPAIPFPSPRGAPSTRYEQYAGADFAIDRIIDALAKDIRSEAAVLKYLRALMALKRSPYLQEGIRTSTRIRLQGELYALTQPGGPRYATRAVNKEAFQALDSLFPHGRRTRRAINLVFRFWHPQEWPWIWWDYCGMFFTWLGVWIASWWLALLRPLAGVVQNRTRRRRGRE